MCGFCGYHSTEQLCALCYVSRMFLSLVLREVMVLHSRLELPGLLENFCDGAMGFKWQAIRVGIEVC